MKLHTEILIFKKNMVDVTPPGAVATALRHVRYWKQARSASDTRPHRAVPVAGPHRARSLTCILTAGPDAALARITAHCSTTTTRRRLRVGGVPTNTYLNPPRPPDRRWRSPSGSAVATGRTDDPHSATSWQQKTQLRGVINVRTHEDEAENTKIRIYA